MIEKTSLYWVTTPCNMENWFIIASSEKEARNLHENGEGFDNGYSRAKELCLIPTEILELHQLCSDTYWPSLALLESLGFKIIEKNFPRIVAYKSKVFYEGSGLIKMTEYHTSKSSGIYILNIVDTEHYKVGYTKNLKARLKAFRTSLPYPIRLRFFIMTTHYKQLEKQLHGVLFPNLIRGEWYLLNKNEINLLKKQLKILDKNKFHLIDFKEMPYDL